MGNRCEQNSDKKEKWSPRTSTASSHLWFANCSLWYYPSNWTYFPALHLRPLSPSSGNIPVLISRLILTLSSFAQLQLLLLLVHSQDPPHLPGLPPPSPSSLSSPCSITLQCPPHPSFPFISLLPGDLMPLALSLGRTLHSTWQDAEHNKYKATVLSIWGHLLLHVGI